MMQNQIGTTRRLGVIGGLGPMASARFYERVTQMTSASSDQEHLEIVLLSLPRTPDRTSYILGSSEYSPVPALVTAIGQLSVLGAEVVAIPCVTAHCFFSALKDQCPVALINMIEESAACLSRHGIRRAGLMATDGTLQCRVFQEVLTHYDIEAVQPDEAEQRQVMRLIYSRIKANRPIDSRIVRDLSERLQHRGAQAILLGCTELSLIDKKHFGAVHLFDALEILAAACVDQCEATLTTDAARLLTGVWCDDFSKASRNGRGTYAN